MTVPKNFRRNSPIPDVLVLHYGEISPEETNEMYGVKTTNPMRTVIDIITEGNLSEDLLIQAIDEAITRGAITKRELREARQNNRTFDDFMKKHSHD